MLKLEDIQQGAQIEGILSGEVVRIVQVESFGNDAKTVYYKDNQGRLGEQTLFRDNESGLSLATVGKSWAFDANGIDFKLGLEAFRISQAALFDPMMAIHTSNVDPYPHQISAVYEAMLPKQPLRFVLADDPGAGKTIMAGLLIRELLMRADAKRILIVSPGSLTEQWQDELREKFGVVFDIFSREKQEECASGNYFEESDQLICRLDQLSRNEGFQEKLKNTEWDLIIVDEAHKLSANHFGNKINKTKRFLLGELLGSITRHFLLMTATPHNGKEADFQIWLSLLDSDRFYFHGKFRDGAHKVDVSDIMRRMVKEDLLKFDGTKLFPERRAYTANYDLSTMEADLYEQVTTYVREEMNRADKLDGKKKNTIGFALTLLQRRLASSPEAIYQSLKRRRKRLEKRLEETRQINKGKPPTAYGVAETLGEYSVTKKIDVPEDFDELEEELNASEYEAYAEQVVDQASAAETIPELEAEILILKDLEYQAHSVVRSESDKKWEQLRSLLQDEPEIRSADGRPRKLIIFTEHKDTLNYLVERIRSMLGNPDMVKAIHGGVSRDERRKIQDEFRTDPDVVVLVATDAAGEGVNLQNANLMVNYDLPWNPNRLEQRFGRIHRIGQTEVCHLWNIVADQTREGAVFQKLFDKIETERAALGGKVFDVLGEAFDNVSLKDLLVEAIRYGEAPATKAKMKEVIEEALDAEHLQEILKRSALVEQHMQLEDLYAVKEEMEKAEARKLQPYFIRAFFNEAFQTLNGETRLRESGRFEIRHVPAGIRQRDKVIGESRAPVLTKYERICFEKECIRMDGKPMAELIHPMHPLMRSVTDLVLEAHRAKLKQGTILLDPNDDSTEPKVLFMIDHIVREAGVDAKIASRRLQFVTIDEVGQAFNAGWAPHLDLQPLDSNDKPLISDVLQAPWLNNNLEDLALHHAAQQLVPEHFNEVKGRREQIANKVLAAVNERLIKEITYWSTRYSKLKGEVEAGKQPKMQPEMARRRVDDLSARLEQRKAELATQKNVVSSTPVVMSGALVIPQGLLAQRKGITQYSVDAAARARIERIAMTAVMDTEQRFGHDVKDVGAEKCGWDVTARPMAKADGSIGLDRHIEVKGRAKGNDTITITRNEIYTGWNQGDKFILAIVIVDGDAVDSLYYVKDPFPAEPAAGIKDSTYNLEYFISRAIPPEQTL